jgi:hypothetical protein
VSSPESAAPAVSASVSLEFDRGTLVVRGIASARSLAPALAFALALLKRRGEGKGKRKGKVKARPRITRFPLRCPTPSS